MKDTRLYSTKLPKLPQSASEAVNEVLNWLTWDQIKNSNVSQSAVLTNLSLPTSRVAGGGVM